MQYVVRTGFTVRQNIPGRSVWTFTMTFLSWFTYNLSINTCFPYFNIVPLLIRNKVQRVKTPCHVILRDPLLKVLTSLRRYLNNLRCFSEVNLQPLVVIVVLGWPGPHVPSPSSSVETRQKRGMVPIPLRWCRNPVVFDSTCLHSHWAITESSCWHQKGVFSKTVWYDYCRSSMFYKSLAFFKMMFPAINACNSLK